MFDDTHWCFFRIWDRYWDIKECKYKCRYPCVGNILSGGGASSSIVCIVIFGYVVGYDKDSGGNPYKLSKSDHRGYSTEKHRRDVVKTVVRRGVEVICNLDSGQIHRPQTGDGVALYVLKTDLWSLWKEARFQDRGAEEETVVEVIGDMWITRGHACGGLMGGQLMQGLWDTP